MNDYETLNHTTWDCKYHIVFIPKRRRKVLYQELRRHLGEVFRQLAAQKDSKIEEGHLLPDHVQMLLSVGQHFWARGYFVNTIGRDENAMRAYIQN